MEKQENKGKVLEPNQDYGKILDQKIEILQSNVDEWECDGQAGFYTSDPDSSKRQEQNQINETNIDLIKTIVKLQVRRRNDNSGLREVSEYVTDYIDAMLSLKTHIVSGENT